MSTSTETKTVQVTSVAPATIPDNHTLIVMSRRSTKENPVATADRYRAIMVHSAQLALPDGATVSKFAALLQATIADLADKKFSAWAKENLLVTQVDPAMFNLDAVITYWAEEKRAAQIDGAKLAAWLVTSETYKALAESTQKIWLKEIPKMAAPSYGNIFSKSAAATIVSKINEADHEHACAQFIMARCNKIIVADSVAEAF